MISLTEQFGLPKRTQLIQLDANTIGIVKKRKSRIIMKDSKQIVDIAMQIRKENKKLNIMLIISGPICSKSIKFLGENKIDILEEKE